MIKDGIININKPQGMTSNDVIYKMRAILGIKKLGHTGTLDPLATGVLPVLINRATRVAEYMDVDFKTYRCTMILGMITDTQDIGGKVIKSAYGGQAELVDNLFQMPFRMADGSDENYDEEMAKAENENKGQQEPVQPKVEKSSGDDKKKPQKADKATKKDYVPPFDFESDIPRTEQYINAHEDAMKWSFTTIEQYSALMLWRYNIRTKVYNDGIQYNGITKDMHIDAVAVNEKELGIEALKAVIKRSEDCSGNSRNSMKYKRTQKERIEKLSQWAAKSSDSWIAYRKLMERKGVYVVLSWNENNEPFGVTYLDRATKCAWKASDTKTDFAWLKDMAEQKGWEFSRHPRFEREEKAEFKASMTSEQMKKASSRKQANRAIRDTGSPSVLETLANKKGVGKTHRSNVDASKNKDRLKKEGEEQNEIII